MPRHGPSSSIHATRDREILRLRGEGYTTRQAAAELGLAHHVVREVWQIGAAIRPETLEWRPGDVTPDEIAAACLQIQAGWSERERQQRMDPLLRETVWKVPAVKFLKGEG